MMNRLMTPSTLKISSVHELDALANCNTDGDVRPRQIYIGLKRFQTRSKLRAKH